MNFKIYLGSISEAVADREKERNTEIQKLEYLENENSFLDEINLVKNQKLIKNSDPKL